MRKSGFTLLELLVVIAIIVILVAMMGPSMWRFVYKVRHLTDPPSTQARRHVLRMGDTKSVIP